VEAGDVIAARELIDVRDNEWDTYGTGLGKRKGDYYPGWLVYYAARPTLTPLPRSPSDFINSAQEFQIGQRHVMRIERGKIVTARLLTTTTRTPTPSNTSLYKSGAR
jgi:hypothetical protein